MRMFAPTVGGFISLLLSNIYVDSQGSVTIEEDRVRFYTKFIVDTTYLGKMFPEWAFLSIKSLIDEYRPFNLCFNISLRYKNEVYYDDTSGIVMKLLTTSSHSFRYSNKSFGDILTDLAKEST